MRLRIVAWFAPVTLLATSAAYLNAQAGPPVPVHGRALDIQFATGDPLRGELIEAMASSFVLQTEQGLHEVEYSDVTRLRFQRHAWGGGRVAAWVGIGALVTGVGMTAACASYEDSSGCMGVFAGVVASWAVFGGLFGLALARSAWDDVPADQASIRAFARFPQGAPPGFRPPRGR